MTAPGLTTTHSCPAPPGWQRGASLTAPAGPEVGRAGPRVVGFRHTVEGLVGARLVQRPPEQRPGVDLDVVGRQRPAVGARALPGRLQQPQLRVVDVAPDAACDVPP